MEYFGFEWRFANIWISRLFKLKPGLNVAGVLEVLQPEPGKLCHLLKLFKRSDENRNVWYKMCCLVCVWRLKISTENRCFAVEQHELDCVWNVMTHAQKPDFVFRRNGRVHLNRWGRHFSRLLAAEVCASAVVMLDTRCSEVAWEYWLPTPFASFPFTSPSVRHRVPSRFNWTLPCLLGYFTCVAVGILVSEGRKERFVLWC